MYSLCVVLFLQSTVDPFVDDWPMYTERLHPHFAANRATDPGQKVSILLQSMVLRHTNCFAAFFQTSFQLRRASKATEGSLQPPPARCTRHPCSPHAPPPPTPHLSIQLGNVLRLTSYLLCIWKCVVSLFSPF